MALNVMSAKFDEQSDLPEEFREAVLQNAADILSGVLEILFSSSLVCCDRVPRSVC